MLTGEAVSPGSLSLEGGVRCYPDRVRTIVEALDRAVQRFPDTVALETPEGDVTYAELAELVEGASERLLEEGLVPGDRFAVALRNGLDIVVAIWAAARTGTIFVGLSTKLAPTQWAYMLAHSGAGLAPDRIRAVGDHLTGRRGAGRP